MFCCCFFFFFSARDLRGLRRSQHSVRAALCCHLANASDLLTPVLQLSAVGGSKLQSYFSPFVDQSSPDYVSKRGRGGSLQCRFPIVDILFRSEDIRDRSAKSYEISPKNVFRPPIFWGWPQILDLVFKIAPISDHVAKFRGDGPRNRGDLALNKKRKETAAKQKGSRVALSQRVALINVWEFDIVYPFFCCTVVDSLHISLWPSRFAH